MIDVAIIGAGPAGSSAAIELARAGRRVVLIDKARFPRSKVCGGCLSGPAAIRFKQLLGPGRQPPGTAGSRIVFVIGSYRLTCSPGGATWMVSRAEMDAALAETAAVAGAEVRFGKSASIEAGDHGWDILVDGERIRPRHVLLASGLSGLPARIGIRNASKATPMIAQQWVQPAVSPLPSFGSVELHWLRGGYVGLATPQPNSCVVALACTASGEAGESAFDRLRRTNPGADIWNMLGDDAPRCHQARGTAGFPWMPERLSSRNALLIGDAAGYAEPYSGEGIGQAMCSAACASRAILAGGDVATTYSVLMEREHRRVVWRTRLISTILSHPVVQYVVSLRPIVPERWLSRLVESVHVKGSL